MVNLELLARLQGLTMEFADESLETGGAESAGAVLVLTTLVGALLEGRTAELSKVVDLYFVEDLTPLTASVRQY